MSDALSDMHPISDTLPWYTNPTSPLSPQDNSREEKWSDRQLVQTLVPAGRSRAMARQRGRPELKVGYWVGKEKGCYFLDQGTWAKVTWWLEMISANPSLNLMHIYISLRPRCYSKPHSAFSFPNSIGVVNLASSEDLLWVAGHSSLTSFARPAWLGHVRHSDMHPIWDTLPTHYSPHSAKEIERFPQSLEREDLWAVQRALIKIYKKPAWRAREPWNWISPVVFRRNVFPLPVPNLQRRFCLWSGTSDWLRCQ